MNTEYSDKYINLGLNIRYYRKLNGLSQSEFAALTNKSLSFISSIESPTFVRGVSLPTLFKMSEILDVEPYMLLEDTRS